MVTDVFYIIPRHDIVHVSSTVTVIHRRAMVFCTMTVTKNTQGWCISPTPLQQKNNENCNIVKIPRFWPTNSRKALLSKISDTKTRNFRLPEVTVPVKHDSFHCTITDMPQGKDSIFWQSIRMDRNNRR